MRLKISLILMSMCLLPACSLHGRQIEYEDIQVRSKPSDADVKFSTGEFCMTPCVVARPVGQPFTLAVRKLGYKPRWVKVSPTPPPEPAADTAGEEAAQLNRFSPNPVFVTLEPAWSK